MISVTYSCGAFYLSDWTYDTVEGLVTALKEDEVTAILVDMYLPSKRKDLFNGTSFETFLFPKRFSYGALLRGNALRLERDLKNLHVANRVQETFLTDDEIETNDEDDEEVITRLEKG